MLSQLSNPWWVFVVLGIGAGLMGGALGLGGGTLIVPTLVLVCSYGQKSAQGTALLKEAEAAGGRVTDPKGTAPERYVYFPGTESLGKDEIRLA